MAIERNAYTLPQPLLDDAKIIAFPSDEHSLFDLSDKEIDELYERDLYSYAGIYTDDPTKLFLLERLCGTGGVFQLSGQVIGCKGSTPDRLEKSAMKLNRLLNEIVDYLEPTLIREGVPESAVKLKVDEMVEELRQEYSGTNAKRKAAASELERLRKQKREKAIGEIAVGQAAD